MFKIIKEELQYIREQSNVLSLAIVSSMMFTVLGFLPYISLAHFPFIIIALILFVLKIKSVDLLSFLLVIYLPLTILFGDPDPVFRSWQRYILFLVVFLFASPLLRGTYIAKFRRSVLFTYLGFATIIALLSFICYFLGINYMKNFYDGSSIDYLNSTAGFAGLTIHSMILGPMSGMGALYLYYRYLYSASKNKSLFVIAICLCVIVCLFSASRSSLISTLSGLLIMLYMSSKKNGSFILTLFAILLIGMLTMPLWENTLGGILAKQEASEELGQFGSRTIKWTARFNEFKENPLFGVGFAAIDPNGIDEYDMQTGNIEPGTSWLSILSMTGIVGFILFISLLLKPIRYLRTHPTPYNNLLLGLLVFLLVHFIAEGYIFAGGGISCLRAWLVIGCVYDQMCGYNERVII